MADVDDDDAAVEESLRPRGMWSGTISFGLVSVPVALYPAVRSAAIRRRMLAPDGTPLARRYYCPNESAEVHPEHLIRGYEVDEGRYVTITAEELESLEPEKSRDIDLQQFVALDELDPVYFERAYYLVPDSNSTKAYRLLAHAMETTERAGIARFVMRDREYLVAIIAENGILRAETLRFVDEIRSPEEIDLPEPIRAPSEARAKFSRAIEKLSRKSLDMDELADEQTGRLLKLIERKRRAKKDIVEVDELVAAAAEGRSADDGEEGEPADLIEILRASLAGRAARPNSRRAGRDEAPSREQGSRAGRQRTRSPARRRE